MPPDEKSWQMRRVIRSLIATITLGIQAGPMLIAMLVGENTLEIQVASKDGDASRSYAFQLNRLAPDPNAEGDTECPEPAVDSLLYAVAELETAVAQ